MNTEPTVGAQLRIQSIEATKKPTCLDLGLYA